MDAREHYEGLFVLDPDLSEEALGKFQTQIAEQITKLGGVIERQQPWGKRRLAYRVRKHRDGAYFLVVCQLATSAVGPLDQWCALQGPILRRLIIRAAEEGLQPVEAATGHGNVQ